MSGRLATTHTKRRAAAPVTVVLLALLAATVLAGVVAGTASAEPPKPPTKTDDPNKIDQKNPLGADGPRRPALAKFAVPNPDRAIFARIEDFKPVASEAENSDEYQAWCEIVTHAKQFTAAELEQVAARDLTPLDLLKTRMLPDPNNPLKPRASPFRCNDPIRFDGKLSCVRRLDAPLFFKNNKELGVAELYEARLVPVDESPLTPVSIVFTDLPEFLGAVRSKPVGEWTDATGYVSAAGYYFKTMNVPGEQGNAVVGVPVLIGKSVTALSGHPTPPGDDPTVIDPNVRVFKFIRDKTKIAGRPPTANLDTPWEEPAAYDRVVRHAARFSAEELEKHARDDLKFADLFLDGSGPGYRLQLVKLEGRLISLRRFDPPAELKSAEIENMYEAWLVPANEPRGNPVVIVYTEPLDGVPPGGRVNKWVSFAGYYFKKMRYTSAEPDPKDPNKNVIKDAPLLIGRSPIPRRDPDEPTAVTWNVFVEGAIIGGAVLIALAGVLTWYYRRGDRRAKESMDNVRHRNPFDAQNATTAPPT